MRVKKRILLIFGIALITTAVFFYFLYYNNQKFVHNSSQVLQAQNIIKNIDSTFYSIADVELAAKNFVISGDSSFEDKMMSDIKTLKRIIWELNNLSGVSTSENLVILGVIQQINQKIAYELEIIQSSKDSRQNALDLLTQMKDQPVTISLKQMLSGLREIYSNELNNKLADNKTIF